MSTDATVSFDDLEAALYWVSSDGGMENRAFISKASGAVYHSSADGIADEELPEDIDDATMYLSVPNKNELELDRSLAVRYVEEELQDDLYTVQGYFHRRGAYSNFKALLQRRGKLDHWFEYEKQATRHALLQWAAESSLQVQIAPRQQAGA